MDIRAHAPERTRVGVRTTSKDGEAGIAHGRGGGTVVWSEVSGSCSQPQSSRQWDRGKDRRATFDDVGGHNVTTKTIFGARVRQQVGCHGARTPPRGTPPAYTRGGKETGNERPRHDGSAFWGCRACKAARDEATKEAREARRRYGERRDWDDWTQETGRQRAATGVVARWRTC